MDVNVSGTGHIGPIQAATLADAGQRFLLASRVTARVIVEARNLYNPEHLATAGLHCSGIGSRHIVPEAVHP